MKYSQRVTTRNCNSRLNQHKLQVPWTSQELSTLIAQRHPKCHSNACLDRTTRTFRCKEKACTCELLCNSCNCKIAKLDNPEESSLWTVKLWHLSLTGYHSLPLISIPTELGWAVIVRLQAKGRKITMVLEERNRKWRDRLKKKKKKVLQSFPCKVTCMDCISLKVY